MTGGGFSLDEQPLYSSFTRTKTFDPRPPAMQYQAGYSEGPPDLQLFPLLRQPTVRQLPQHIVII
jgi:hypothetical protein